MVLAHHNDVKLIKRGENYTVSYRTGSITVPSKTVANKIYDRMKVK